MFKSKRAMEYENTLEEVLMFEINLPLSLLYM